MAKLNHERDVFRLQNRSGGEPHWSGFEAPKKPARKRKNTSPSPKMMAERLGYMRHCLLALETGDGFPPVPNRLKAAIMVSKKFDKRYLVVAWIGRQDDWREVQSEVRLRVAENRLKKIAKAQRRANALEGERGPEAPLQEAGVKST